jgi:hypothetical protein
MRGPTKAELLAPAMSERANRCGGGAMLTRLRWAGVAGAAPPKANGSTKPPPMPCLIAIGTPTAIDDASSGYGSNMGLPDAGRRGCTLAGQNSVELVTSWGRPAFSTS